jgi:hypothetical protein
MSKEQRPTRKQAKVIKDARGRLVIQLDPVKMHIFNQDSLIPAETLQAMVDEILPGASRKRLIQVVSVVLGFLFVVGGNIIYFRYFSTWRGLDPVNTTIYAIQIVVLLSGPIIAFRIARTGYASCVAAVMLKHLRCPHCAYDLRLLPTDPKDGATVCPECGCAWHLGREDATWRHQQP